MIITLTLILAVLFGIYLARYFYNNEKGKKKLLEIILASLFQILSQVICISLIIIVKLWICSLYSQRWHIIRTTGILSFKVLLHWKLNAVEFIIDVDGTDDLVLLTNTQAQADYWRHSLEQTTRSIGLYVNSDKTEFMSFK